MSKSMLYIVPGTDFGTPGTVGVRKKIMGQCAAFAKLGYTPTTVLYENGNVLIQKHDEKPVAFRLSRILWYIGCFRHILQKHFRESCDTYDLVYVRKTVVETLFSLGVAKLLRRYSHKIVYEIPNYPYDDEMKGIFRKRLFLRSAKDFVLCIFGWFISDRIFRNFLKKHIDFFVVINRQPEHGSVFGARAMKIDNGIDVDTISERCRVPDDTLVLIGVANISYWHGYDRLISGMHKYYSDGGEVEIVFHVVGEGPSAGDLRKLTSALGMDDRVIFHGIKTGPELDEIFSKADIGIASLGMFRQNIAIGSTLKASEYCARKLPFVTGVEEFSIPDSFLWKLRVANDESPIDIEELVKFSLYCRSNQDRLGEMRDFAEKNLSWETQLNKVLCFAEENGVWGESHGD